VITLKEALRQMEATDLKTGKFIPFDLKYCQFSRMRAEGGKIIEYKHVVLSSDKDQPTEQPQSADKANLDVKQGASNISRNPYHRRNKTRNIKLLNGDIRKIRFRGILEFNNQQVLY
jgi:hypothetical protein